MKHIKQFWTKYKGGIMTIVLLPLAYLFLSNLVSPKSKDKPAIIETNNTVINPVQDTTPKVKIDNTKGNINVNQQGGKVVQVYNESPKTPPPRTINKADIKRLENEIPKDYKVSLVYELDDKEVEKYMNQLVNKLKALGFNVELAGAGRIIAIGDDKSKRFTIASNSSNKEVTINIIKQLAQ